jgi:hypothetical protein
MDQPGRDEMSGLSPDVASQFARAALGHVTREFPNKLDHVMSSADDAKTPRLLHPIFFGSFDWHSCVHGYWLLATILREFPALPEAKEIAELFGAQITRDNVAAELIYLEQPLRGTFERPYGWAWLLMLSAELERHRRKEPSAIALEEATWPQTERRSYAETLAPLTAAFVKRFFDFLPKATYPVRVGTHFNTAFAIALATEYAEIAANDSLRDLLKEKAMAWYGNDADCPAWEPGGDDFLSSALIEAECMRRVMPPADFENWFSRFLPRIAQREPATLFKPATVTDRSDGKIAHLDGVNLTRAWCWRSLAKSMRDGDPRRAVALAAAEDHLAASLPHVTGDYMGEHWLATFALLALRA